jgi:hypothetical protein
MRVLIIVAAAATIALVAVRPAQSQAVPDLNVDPVCHGIAQQAANPSEKGGPDLAFSQCVQSEQAVRQKLVNEWSTFLPTEKSNCIGAEMGGMASYTDLAVSKWQESPGSSIKASSDRGPFAILNL